MQHLHDGEADGDLLELREEKGEKNKAQSNFKDNLMLLKSIVPAQVLFRPK